MLTFYQYNAIVRGVHRRWSQHVVHWSLLFCCKSQTKSMWHISFSLLHSLDSLDSLTLTHVRQLDFTFKSLDVSTKNVKIDCLRFPSRSSLHNFPLSLAHSSFRLQHSQLCVLNQLKQPIKEHKRIKWTGREYLRIEFIVIYDAIADSHSPHSRAQLQNTLRRTTITTEVSV